MRLLRWGRSFGRKNPELYHNSCGKHLKGLTLDNDDIIFYCLIQNESWVCGEIS